MVEIQPACVQEKRLGKPGGSLQPMQERIGAA
jgi:hypothetical protein